MIWGLVFLGQLTESSADSTRDLPTLARVKSSAEWGFARVRDRYPKGEAAKRLRALAPRARRSLGRVTGTPYLNFQSINKHPTTANQPYPRRRLRSACLFMASIALASLS